MEKGAPSHDRGITKQIGAERAKASALHSEVKALTEVVLAASGGLACAIQWQSLTASGTSAAVTASFSESAINTILALVERRLRRSGHSAQSLHMRAGEIAAHLNGEAAGSVEAVALASFEDNSRIVSVVVAPLGRAVDQMGAAAQLANDTVRASLRASSAETTLEFWRERSATMAERLTELTRQHESDAAENALIESTVASCLKLAARDRFDGLGSAVAETAHFDLWIIAIGPPDALQIVASAKPLAPTLRLEGAGVIADAIRRSATVIRRPEKRGIRTAEDRLFAPYAGYMCVPFVGGAIALAARKAIVSAAQHRVEKLLRRLNPINEKWLLQDELSRLQQLVRTLGVRLFTAIDNERHQVARDLHDHQAQLITAARIALEADPSEARGILKQLDEVLRMRIRELRPATLGRSDLQEALRHEIRRLGDAGIQASIVHLDQAANLSRPIQQLCYQLVREAFSNVIRHAEATRVTIAIERSERLAHVVIEDNGKGFRAAKGHAKNGRGEQGAGLIGMAERVELMGGRFSIERIDKITRLTAQIPEL